MQMIWTRPRWVISIEVSFTNSLPLKAGAGLVRLRSAPAFQTGADTVFSIDDAGHWLRTIELDMW